MRIGILTLNLHTNYGGILQAYALQTVLERMGHDVKVIRKNNLIHMSFMKKIVAYPYRFLKKIFFDREILIAREEVQKNNIQYLSKNVNSFVHKYIHSFMINNLVDIRETDFDAFVVGSDQVWRPKYFMSSWGNNVKNSFLDFAKDWKIKRYAYAASLGLDRWEYPSELKNDLMFLAKKFDKISVREKSSVSLCIQNLKVKPDFVLDPTLLLDRKDYEKLIPYSHNKESNLLFCYILDRTVEINNFITRVSIAKKLNTSFMSAHTQKKILTEKDALPSIESWLQKFRDASFIITDSFHACVFSIIFHKPFVVLGNKERGMSRFESLLTTFGLESHLLYGISDYDASMSYELSSNCYETLSRLKINSSEFLQTIK